MISNKAQLSHVCLDLCVCVFSFQVGSLDTSRTRGVTCTTSRPCTSALSALHLTLPAWGLLEIASQPPPLRCLPHSTLRGTSASPSARHTSSHTPPPPPPPPAAAPPSSLLCQRCDPHTSERRAHQQRLHPCYILRSALPLQKALQCPLVSRLSTKAPERFTATSTATSRPYIFDSVCVCV